MAKRSNEFGALVGRAGRLLGVALFVFSTGAMCDIGKAQQRLSHQELIKLSRESCVRVWVNGKKRHGSGFFIDPNHVITCCHVISAECSYTREALVGICDPNKLNLKWRPFTDIIVETADAKDISAECISVPVSTDPDPAIWDFAILRLKDRPAKIPTCVPLCQDTANLIVGDDVYFSGFPLGAPTMLTHKGMLSGFATNQVWLCIQAPINKGNSGGALLSAQGQVIGIISEREGGISAELDRVRKTIAALNGRNVMSFSLNGETVDLLTVDKDTIDILDHYISTGIGYARNVAYVRSYIQRHPLAKPVAGTK